MGGIKNRCTTTINYTRGKPPICNDTLVHLTLYKKPVGHRTPSLIKSRVSTRLLWNSDSRAYVYPAKYPGPAAQVVSTRKINEIPRLGRDWNDQRWHVVIFVVALCTKPGRGISDFMSTLIYVDVFKPLHVVIGFAKKKRVLGSQICSSFKVYLTNC